MKNNATRNRIKKMVEVYQKALREHPISALVLKNQVPAAVLNSFAHLHYLFSTNWGTVIGTVRDISTDEVFRAALAENMGDELGHKQKSHVTLCREFLISQGLVPSYGTGLQVPPIACLPMNLMDALPCTSEAFAAGYMLCSESIIPDMFRLFLPAFEKRRADCTYLNEHLEVDEAKHSQMLEDAVMSILSKGGKLLEVAAGIELGGRSIVCQADFFFSKAMELNTVHMHNH